MGRPALPPKMSQAISVTGGLQVWLGSGIQVSEGGGFWVQGQLTPATAEARGEQPQLHSEALCTENVGIWAPGVSSGW